MENNPNVLVGALVDFVRLFDITGRWNEEEQESATVAADALRSIFLTKVHIVDMLVFTGEFIHPHTSMDLNRPFLVNRSY